jgi:hypothetical protein
VPSPLLSFSYSTGEAHKRKKIQGTRSKVQEWNAAIKTLHALAALRSAEYQLSNHFSFNIFNRK